MIQLIPSMDLLNGRIVRLRRGDAQQITHYDLSPEAWIERLAEAGATRIHLVDLNGAFGLARQGAFGSYPKRHPGIRFQVGGGLRDRSVIQRALEVGLDAVVGTLAVEQPQALAGLPPERIICALDLRGDRVVTQGWTAESSSATSEVFKALLGLGFRQALVTDVGRDGTLEGPGLEAVALVAREGFRVQASGGLRGLEDLGVLGKVPGVVGAISGKALLENRIPLEDPATREALGAGGGA